MEVKKENYGEIFYKFGLQISENYFERLSQNE
jgi:hypothetical protein